MKNTIVLILVWKLNDYEVHTAIIFSVKYLSLKCSHVRKTVSENL